MPVTARLSKVVYDRLGDEVANAIVDWFNQVDLTYRTGLKELNDLNWARFEAKLEQRVTELEAKLGRRITEVEARITAVETGLEAKLSAKIDGVEARLDAKIDRVAAELRETLEKALKEQVRWQAAAWVALLIPIIGLWFRG